MTTASPSKTCRPTRLKAADQASIRRRTLALLRSEVEFIANPEFQDGYQCRPEIVDAALSAPPSHTPDSLQLPGHLRRMCETVLLTPQQESSLFREMNFLKFRANALRSRLDPERLHGRLVEGIEALLERAGRIRDHLIRANLRLAISIVKKFVTPQHSFDELFSDAMPTLIQAVEKFDFARGFRFSTYAYRSITRSTFRTLDKSRKQDALVSGDLRQGPLEPEDDNLDSPAKERLVGRLRELTTSMLRQLDRRERFIIRSRYALGAHRKTRTFQDLANRLGISKQRVRQLEQRAVAKLRSLAREHDVDDLFPASMV